MIPDQDALARSEYTAREEWSTAAHIAYEARAEFDAARRKKDECDKAEVAAWEKLAAARFAKAGGTR